VLVFTRKRDDAIVIGDGIEVRVVRIGRDSVRLGITAPAHIAVHRREVYDAICRANRAAASDPTVLDRLAARLRGAVLPGPSRS